MKITDIIISSIESIAGSSPLILIDIKKDYKYENGTRTNEEIGLIYKVVCAERDYTTLSVKVQDTKSIVTLAEIKNSQKPIYVNFIDFEGKFYKNFKTGEYFLSCKAKGVETL